MSISKRDVVTGVIAIASVLALSGIGLTATIASGLYDIGADVPHSTFGT